MEKKEYRSKVKADLPYLGILGIIAAFIGWIVENIFRVITVSKFDCRFHLLPFISPYGLAVFAIYLVIGDSNNISFFGHELFKNKTKKSIVWSNVITFLIICLAVFFGELVVGNLWDVLFDVKLWNYSKQPFHVTRYAGLLTSLSFGVGVYLLQKVIMYPALNFLKKRVSYKSAVIFSVVVGSIIVLDTIIMMLNIIFCGRAKLYWQVMF